MLLIFGTTVRDRLLAVVHFVCEFCRVPASQDVIESATKLSVFFLPLFTVSRRYLVVCRNCGGATALSREQATHGMEWAAAHRQVT